MRVEKYGRDGRADGAALVASGLRVIWLILDDSSGTMRWTSADSPCCRKSALFLTSSLVKSHSVLPPGGDSPCTTGLTNWGHNLAHIDLKVGIEPAVGPTRVS